MAQPKVQGSASEPRYSFTQPCCEDCWTRAWGQHREPTRLREPEDEVCCHCGRMTLSGIFVRVDPSSVPNPTRLKDV